MKVEFKLEIQEAVLMIDILRKAAYQSTNPNVKTVLGNIINEIESDSKVAHSILNTIRHQFHTNNLTNSKVYPHSNMEYGLNIPKPFLKENAGLPKMVNFIFYQTLKKFKPKINPRSVKPISPTAVKKCVIVNDVISLIQSNYEAT